MTLEHDYLLNGRYRIVETLGQGGMGAVYQAIDENLGLEVAVKENFYTTDEYSRQFRREATILASSRHTNLPRVSDHFEIEGQGQYLVMDYIEGEDLRQRMDRLGVLSEEEVIVTGAAICDALHYLHTRKPPILHRDLKPGNIKIDPEGVVYLVDFGLAKIVKGSQVTTTGARAMTPGYSSPEQYGTKRTDARSDVYSLGATLYATLTNTIPEDGLARAMEQADLTPIRKHNPKLSRRLAVVIEKALAVFPEDRYQTAEEFKEALLQASTSTRNLQHTDEMTVEPPPEEVIEEIARGKKRRVKGAIEPEMKGEPISRSRRRKKQRRKRIFWMFFVLFLGAGGSWYGFGMPGKESLSELILLALNLTPNPTATMEIVVTPTSEPTEIELTPTDTLIHHTATFTPVLPTDTPLPPIEEPTQETAEEPTEIPTPTLPPIPGMSITPTTTPENFEYPRDDEVIAFASHRSGSVQIWLYSFADESSVQLTDIEGGACQPAWSPDGRRLAFISPCRRNQLIYLDARIYVMSLETLDTVMLPVEEGSFDPAWSPDGNTILFTRAEDVYRSRIYRLDMGDGSIQWMSGREKFNADPEWSPDGSHIVFVSTRFTGFYIYIMPNEPGAEALILTRSGNKNNYNPTWSVMGDIVFSQGKTGGIESLVKVTENMIGVDAFEYEEFRVNVDLNTVPEVDPDFSTDGFWLAFEGWPDGSNHDIYLMRADGKLVIRITTHSAIDFDPAWMPLILE
ncbi:MAG: serine/threonine-protein kinase [Anaerolineales bacterium]|nr:MAG: serine/threonine-protein kinase [Anaerolineales bacterium]